MKLEEVARRARVSTGTVSRVLKVSGVTAAAASGEALAAPAVDSVNTFESPKTVAPKPITAKVQDGQVALTLDPKSVTVIAIR